MMELIWYVIAVLFSLQLVHGAYNTDTFDIQNQRNSRERRSTRACHQKYHGISGHTACLGPSSNLVSSGVTDSEKTTIVNEHNTYRSNVSPTAQNMVKMSWDDEIAMLAQNWAENCEFKHDNSYKRFIPGRLQLGQNMFSSSNQQSWESVIESWHSEVNDFTYNGANSKVVGHYTQIVWAKSVKIGCGYANCGSSGGHIYVCNYGPAGNSVSSIYVPYTSGSTCNQCQGRCSNKLCDCSGLVCLNGGTMNLDTCTCTCKNHPHYVGNQCELNCSLLSQPSTCSQYSVGQCSVYSNVPFDCPKLCSVCPYGGLAYQSTTTAGTTTTIGGPSSKMGLCVVPSVFFLTMLLILIFTIKY